MKFELTEKPRKEEFEQKNKNGKAGFIDKYIDANEQDLPELLEKRKKDAEVFEKREAERKRKLEEAEKEGKIFLKNIK